MKEVVAGSEGFLASLFQPVLSTNRCVWMPLQMHLTWFWGNWCTWLCLDAEYLSFKVTGWSMRYSASMDPRSGLGGVCVWVVLNFCLSTGRT